MEQENENLGSNLPEDDFEVEDLLTPEQESVFLDSLRNKNELTYEERRILRGISKRKREEERIWCEEHGIVKQVLFDNVCRTTPDYIENILRLLFTRLSFDKPSLVEGFELVKWAYAPTLELKVSFSNLGKFGGLGTIYVTPINDIESRIEVICGGELVPNMEREEAAELYRLMLELLKVLAKELSFSFKITGKDPTLTTHTSNNQVYPPGRSREVGYDNAFTEVQHYMAVDRITKANAIKQAYNRYIEIEKIKPDKYSFESFRAAMNYRLSKAKM